VTVLADVTPVRQKVEYQASVRRPAGITPRQVPLKQHYVVFDSHIDPFGMNSRVFG